MDEAECLWSHLDGLEPEVQVTLLLAFNFD